MHSQQSPFPLNKSIEAIEELVQTGIVRPLSRDIKLHYPKTKLYQKWKKMFTTTLQLAIGEHARQSHI